MITMDTRPDNGLDIVKVRTLTGLVIYISGFVITVSFRRCGGMSDADLFSRVISEALEQLKLSPDLANVEFFLFSGPPPQRMKLERFIEAFVQCAWENDDDFTPGSRDGWGVLHLTPVFPEHSKASKKAKTRRSGVNVDSNDADESLDEVRS